MGIIRAEVITKKEFFEDVQVDADYSIVATGKVFLIEDDNKTPQELKEILLQCHQDVLFDPLVEEIYYHTYQITQDFSSMVEVSFRPGVTDNMAHSLTEILAEIGIKATVACSKMVFLKCSDTCGPESILKFAKVNLYNDLIQAPYVYDQGQFKSEQRFLSSSLPKVVKSISHLVETISLDISDNDFLQLSKERCLALTLDEMLFIKDHYNDSSVAALRQENKMPAAPTDLELEVIAQTWSEHCRHKIFQAEIDYTENFSGSKKLGNKKITKGLYSEYIKATTKDIVKQSGMNWAISVFSDNAGIVRFDENVDLCIKVETHNSPSALDPYGGAITGILGVNRDILGCGMGAKPICNMDVFMFAPPHWPRDNKHLAEMPAGLLAPKKLLEGVHLGVEDGGNKSGIPTVNGAIYFDASFAGKPLVFVGTVGVMPAQLASGKKTFEKDCSVGDHIFMVGGAIGADGIHGATFSSLELNEDSPATAVQIGDPLTQKRVLDFIIEARDLELFTSITDNGAGGLSSSVGEMATMTNGASIDLALAPVKYPGLTPYELMISESQERMTVAVAPDQCQAFLELAQKRGVSASDIGEFTASGFLEVFYQKERVGHLDLDFLHEQLPKMKLSAVWDGPYVWPKFCSNDELKSFPTWNQNEIENSLLELLARPNIASKESWVRRYDHEVQAATHIKPFGGETGAGPNDSGVIWLHPHGGAKDAAFCVGAGMNPRLSQFDPYYMAQYSVDEAVRNIVATGGDPDHCCILDNFCWPDPVKSARNTEGDKKLGYLVRACAGLRDIALAWNTPLVSGKDSMKNDFRGKNNAGVEVAISILPTLLITAMASAKMGQTVTSDFKQAGDTIYLLGDSGSGLLASEFSQAFKHNSKAEIDTFAGIDIKKNIELYRQIHQAIKKGLLASCHDVSDGGAICAITESLFGNNLGATIDLKVTEILDTLYNEKAGRFIVSVSTDNITSFETLFKADSYQKLGAVTSNGKLQLSNHNIQLINLKTESLLAQWQKEF